LDKNSDYWGDYINDTLDFTRMEDRTYTTIERECGKAECSLKYRIY